MVVVVVFATLFRLLLYSLLFPTSEFTGFIASMYFVLFPFFVVLVCGQNSLLQFPVACVVDVFICGFVVVVVSVVVFFSFILMHLLSVYLQPTIPSFLQSLLQFLP